LQLNDTDFLRGFEACTLSEFHHRDHLRLTWVLIRRDGREKAKAAIVAGIKRFAEAHGQVEKYHQTMTEFWVDVVDYHIGRYPSTDDFDRFLADWPKLLDKSLPFRHWTRETIMDDLARSQWVPPDLLSLPWYEPRTAGLRHHA
jgi:hypothetical protein